MKMLINNYFLSLTGITNFSPDQVSSEQKSE